MAATLGSPIGDFTRATHHLHPEWHTEPRDSFSTPAGTGHGPKPQFSFHLFTALTLLCMMIVRPIQHGIPKERFIA
jgi:hypothetical protein